MNFVKDTISQKQLFQAKLCSISKTAFAVLNSRRRSSLFPACKTGIPVYRRIIKGLLCVFIQVSNSLANSGNGFSLLIRNGDVEFLFEFHDQFNSV